MKAETNVNVHDSEVVSVQLDRVGEVKPVDWRKFEPIGSFGRYKPKNHNS